MGPKKQDISSRDWLSRDTTDQDLETQKLKLTSLPKVRRGSSMSFLPRKLKTHDAPLE